MRNAALDEAQVGIKVAGRNINNPRWHQLYGRKWRITKESPDESERVEKVGFKSEKVGLKLNIQKAKIMASGPIISWQIDGETVGTVTDFIFGGLQNHSDGDCSYEIKRYLLLGRKVLTNLDSILKNRDITVNKGPFSQGYGFSSGHV